MSKKEGDLVRYHIGRAPQQSFKSLVLSLLLAVGSLGALATAYELSDHTASAATPPDSCFAFNSGTITDYYDNENNDPGQAACPKDVDVPSMIGLETVTTIATAAFFDMGLTSLTLPSTITTIETAGFDSNELTEISIPSSIVTLGSSAFSNNQLTDIFIPDSVTSLAFSSFYNNPLQSVTIGTADFAGTPELVIPSGMFGSIPTLTNVSLGKNVLEISYSAFSGSSISSLTLSDSITTIRGGALTNNQLTSLFIPNSVTSLGMSVAQNNPLQSVTIGTADFSGTPELVIPSGMFSNVTTLNSLTLGNNVLSISPYTFDGCSISSLVIPDSVTSIGSAAFMGNQISSLTLGDSLASIGDSAFANNHLTELFIPNSVTTLGASILSGNPITSLTIGTADFSGTPTLSVWSGVLSGVTTLSEINLGNNVLSLGSGAFMNNQLTELFIPNSVTLVGSGLVTGNPIESITIGTADFSGTPNTVINYGAFNNINTLTSITLGNNVKTIHSGAFQNDKLTSITIPSSVTTVDPSAFADNPLQIINIRGNPVIHEFSFYHNLDLSTIPGGLSGENLAQYYQDNAEYVRMYASDPDFIAAHGPGQKVTETYGSNTYTVSGYVLNPATYNVNYESSTGDSLAPQFVSGAGPSLSDYSITANPTGDFGLYFVAGDSISLQPLAISGYSTPSAYDLVLAAGENSYTFVYGAGQLADTGTSLVTTIGFAALFILAGSLLGAVALRFRP